MKTKLTTAIALLLLTGISAYSMGLINIQIVNGGGGGASNAFLLLIP